MSPAEMRRRYEDGGQSSATIGRAAGVTHETVTNILRTQGVAVRTRGGGCAEDVAAFKGDRDAVLEYVRSHSIGQAAIHWGVSSTLVRKQLDVWRAERATTT